MCLLNQHSSNVGRLAVIAMVSGSGCCKLCLFKDVLRDRHAVVLCL